MTRINYENVVWNIYNHYGEKLTDWETDFIDNMKNQKGSFSERQKEIILQLNRKYVARK